MTQQDKETQPESAETTPTCFVHVREVRLAYRRFGNPAGTPLIFLQHFRGSMDKWRTGTPARCQSAACQSADRALTYRWKCPGRRVHPRRGRLPENRVEPL